MDYISTFTWKTDKNQPLREQVKQVIRKDLFQDIWQDYSTTGLAHFVNSNWSMSLDFSIAAGMTDSTHHLVPFFIFRTATSTSVCECSICGCYLPQLHNALSSFI